MLWALQLLMTSLVCLYLSSSLKRAIPWNHRIDEWCKAFSTLTADILAKSAQHMKLHLLCCIFSSFCFCKPCSLYLTILSSSTHSSQLQRIRHPNINARYTFLEASLTKLRAQVLRKTINMLNCTDLLFHP